MFPIDSCVKQKPPKAFKYAFVDYMRDPANNARQTQAKANRPHRKSSYRPADGIKEQQCSSAAGFY